MRTVATFMDIQEAHIIKGALEAEGIPAVVVDENMTGLVIYTPAIGGARLQVLDEDYNRAMHVLGCCPPGEETASEPAHGDTCPRCGSAPVSTNPLSPKTILTFLSSLLAGIPALSKRRKRVCGKCGEKW